jgi:hypothetical protein
VISFRFHLVSLVAAFLALAVGIVIGTTLADRAIIDGLRSRVDTVSANLDERQAANERLQAENEGLRDYLDQAGAGLVDDDLTGQPVVVVSAAGVDGDVVDRTVARLQDAGAEVRGRVGVRPEWALDEPELRAELARGLDLPRRDPAAMRDRLARLLVADLASPVAVSDDGTGAIDVARDLGLVDYEELDDVVLAEDDELAFVTVTGPAADPRADVDDVVDAAAAAAAPTVATEAFDAAAAEELGVVRGDALAEVREDEVLAEVVATVDDLDVEVGRLTLVLVLADALEGRVGHYGSGPSADARAPVPTGQ